MTLTGMQQGYQIRRELTKAHKYRKQGQSVATAAQFNLSGALLDQ